jgi:hypothetical protein
MPDIAGWKASLIMQEGDHNAVETYYANGALSDVAVATQAVSLANVRVAMLPVASLLKRIRISAMFAPYQTFQLDPTTFPHVGVWVPGPGEPVDPKPDQAKAALQVDKYSGTRHQRGRFYVFSVPDITLGGVDDGRATLSPASWNNAFNNWVTEMKANWRNKFRTDTTGGGLRVQVTGADNAGDNGLFRIVVPIPLATWAVGQRLQLRKFTQLRGTQTTVNGVYNVVKRVDLQPDGASTTFTLRDQVTPDSLSILALGTAELVNFTLEQITKVIPVQQTTRKRGNRSLVGPGRRRIRR